MTQIAKLIGGAGTGKTRELLRIMEQAVEQVGDPLQIGFVSFTRAARAEAAERAGSQFNIDAKTLQQDGWFRTLHSLCFRQLREMIGDGLLTGSKKDAAWLTESLGEDCGEATRADTEDGDLGEIDFGVKTDASIALQLWSTARNRLSPLKPVWELADQCVDVPSLEECCRIVDQYELCKRLDHRLDFTDLLAMYAGYQFRTDGAEHVEPRGDVPPIHVWFFDEQQDCSALLAAVCDRLIQHAEWVYLAGDPFQAIYGWSGADSTHFTAMRADKTRTMPKSYRCPAPMLELGESLLKDTSGYWDRGIAPADHGGEIEHVHFGSFSFGDIEPDQEWLLLARTNQHISRLVAQANAEGLPWVPTKGLGGWNRPSLNAALKALIELQAGLPIAGQDWREVLKHLPSKVGSMELLIRGTKTQWEKGDHARQLRYVPNNLAGLADWGASETLRSRIASGDWKRDVNGGAEFARVYDRYGWEIATQPRLRIGTIHSAKGAEADNVLWLTTASRPVSLAAETQEGHDEECRVNYVAATRAKKRLVIAEELNKRDRVRF